MLLTITVDIEDGDGEISVFSLSNMLRRRQIERVTGAIAARIADGVTSGHILDRSDMIIGEWSLVTVCECGSRLPPDDDGTCPECLEVIAASFE